jgi:hypothetical protein
VQQQVPEIFALVILRQGFITPVCQEYSRRSIINCFKTGSGKKMRKKGVRSINESRSEVLFDYPVCTYQRDDSNQNLVEHTFLGFGD